VDVFSSDYVPGSLIQGVFLMHQQLEVPLPEAVAKITINPAQIASLADRGTIQLGNRADLIRVKLDRSIPVIRNVWRSGQIVF